MSGARRVSAGRQCRRSDLRPAFVDIRHFRPREIFLILLFWVGGVSEMHSQLSRLLATITDTALAREGWPDVLNSLMQALHVPSAAYIVRNKTTGSVDWACFSGLSAEFKSDYVRQYAALDPYSPLLDDTWSSMTLGASCPSVFQGPCCASASGTMISYCSAVFAISSPRALSTRHRTPSSWEFTSRSAAHSRMRQAPSWAACPHH